MSANLQILSEIVRNAGFIARPVINARQAVNAIEAMLPDLILMDISMPDIDGFVFCSMLKKNTATKEIPIMFISALNSLETKIKGFQIGAVDFITKPYEAEELAMRIKLHLKLYQKRTDLERNNAKLYAIINEQMKKIYDAQRNEIYAITSLLEKIDASNTTFYEHLARNAKLVAMSLQLSSRYNKLITTNFIDAIELTAPLLDVGMLLVGDEGRDGRIFIDFEEMELIKNHTTMGAAFLWNICSSDTQNDYIRIAINIAKYHHENWDGSGYPEGITGSDIPLCARIISIVYTYNRLINQTWQGENYTPEKTMKYIVDRSGSCFDPDIVSVLTKIQFQLKN